jgi:glycosyltransferase involved in cell wall biosynthesis
VKILLANDCPVGQVASGGVEQHLVILRDALQARGHTVEVLTRSSPGGQESHVAGVHQIPDLDAPPLRKRFLENRRRRRLALDRIRELLRAMAPDVIHVHNLMALPTLQLLRRSAPMVKSIHDCRPFCTKPPPSAATQLIGRSETVCNIVMGWRCWGRCYAAAGNNLTDRLAAWSLYPSALAVLKEVRRWDRIVVYSRHIQQLALQGGAAAGRIRRLQLFVDTEPPPASRAQDAVPLIVFSGRLTPEKGLRHLLQALRQIAHLSFEVVIAGDGPMRGDLEALICAAGLSGRVRLVGFLKRNEVSELYGKASIAVVPSIYPEGCGLSGVEAMTRGAPVVGFDVGGIGEWLVHDETGIMVRRGDTAGLARGIASLLTDPARREQLGRQAAIRTPKVFSKERHLDDLERIYREAADVRRERQP